MGFTNILVDLDALPRATELNWTAMPPEHRAEVLTQSLIVLGILLMAAIGVAVLPPYPSTLDWLFGRLIPGLILLTGLCITLLVLKRIKWKAYAMRTHDIAYRSGLFWRKVVILPFNRVQHVEVTSGPLQRRFSLATLKFYTAGGSSVDLKIEGLRAEVAEQLRAHILESGAFATGTG